MGTFAINPVTWHELVRHSLAVRDPSLIDAGIWYDEDALRTWTLSNLDTYWRPWLERYEQRGGTVRAQNDLLAWEVLGVTRLHYYTLATGQITSKSRAGQYALKAFGGRWNKIVSEALRIRSGPATPTGYDDLSERFEAAVDYISMVISDAQDLDADA